mgnify:CR=1 FL=1
MAQKVADGCKALGVNVDARELFPYFDNEWFDKVRGKAGGLLTVNHPALVKAIQDEIDMRTVGIVST